MLQNSPKPSTRTFFEAIRNSQVPHFDPLLQEPVILFILSFLLSMLWLLQEARTLAKARKLGVATPALYALDSVTRSLTFEFVEGPLVKDILLQSTPLPSSGMNVSSIIDLS